MTANDRYLGAAKRPVPPRAIRPGTARNSWCLGLEAGVVELSDVRRLDEVTKATIARIACLGIRLYIYYELNDLGILDIALNSFPDTIIQ